MELTVANANVPKEWQDLHDALYGKIKSMVGGGGWDLRKDPTTIRIIIQSAMTAVEKLRQTDGSAYTGAEKRAIALRIIKWVIDDLAKDNIIPKDVADEVNANIDFFGGVAIDMAIAAGKEALKIGQKIIADIKEQQAAADTGVATTKKCCFLC